MDISYFGHSCFRLRGKNGVVVTDPFDAGVGLQTPKLSADIVTVSHGHPAHNHFSTISGTTRRPTPFVIQKPGEYELLGISIWGIPSFHDGEKGALRGTNTIFAIKIDALHIVHLGDLGQELSDEQVDKIGVVDVLLIPVGGVYTIDAKQAMAVIEEVEPSVIIPMHFRTSSSPIAFQKLDPVDTFLKEMGKSDVVPQDRFTVTPDSLPQEPLVVVLTP